MSEMQQIVMDSKSISDQLMIWRKFLHMHPELSGQEAGTKAFLQDQLGQMDIPTHTYPNCHALSGFIQGNLAGPTIALRADMDALPLTEGSACQTPSQCPGVMHACGHDAHMAILLGVAKLLMQRKATLRGNVKLLFEHAEETFGGAKEMVAQGCLEQPPVAAVLGLHVMPNLPVGAVRLSGGPMSGASDDVRILLQGTASHGAYPEKGVDAVVMASQVVLALQTLISRNTSPLDSAALSIGKIAGGQAANVICDSVQLDGTLRTLAEDTRRMLKARIPTVVTGIAQAMGGEAQVDIRDSYPALANDTQLARIARRVMGEMLGEKNVYPMEKPSLGVDSFAFFAEKTKGLYFDLGCGVGSPLHASDFFVDEACLPIGVAVLCATATHILNHLA